MKQALLTATVFSIIALICSGKKNSFLHRVGQTGQTLCLIQIERVTARNLDILKSLICGLPLEHSREKILIQTTGLIHLLVVSGAHFLFLLQLVTLLRIPSLLYAPLLILYLFLTGFQPPGFRFVIQWIIAQKISRLSISFPADLQILFSGLVCLILWPEWMQSFSLQLSWIASLALCTYSLFVNSTSRSQKPSVPSSRAADKLFKENLLLFLFLVWPLSLFSEPNPIVICVNLFMAPVLGGLLFPLGLLSLILPSAGFLFDWIWEGLLFLLGHFFSQQKTTSSQNFWVEGIWIYIFTLHFLIHFSRVFMKRKYFLHSPLSQNEKA